MKSEEPCLIAVGGNDTYVLYSHSSANASVMGQQALQQLDQGGGFHRVVVAGRLPIPHLHAKHHMSPGQVLILLGYMSGQSCSRRQYALVDAVICICSSVAFKPVTCMHLSAGCTVCITQVSEHWCMHTCNKMQ